MVQPFADTGGSYVVLAFQYIKCDGSAELYQSAIRDRCNFNTSNVMVQRNALGTSNWRGGYFNTSNVMVQQLSFNSKQRRYNISIHQM